MARSHWQKFILFFLVILSGGLCFFLITFAYNDTDTHPDLTVEIAKFYNFSNQNNQLTGEETEWMRRGSILEDTPPRWINHFYNPETKTGWEAKNLGDIPQPVLKLFSSLAISSQEPVSSLEWAHNQELQNKYRLYQGNRTWERAIYDFVKGDKRRAFESLGFILHLIEDASVPDHTRSDTHADIAGTNEKGSPYEKWAEEYTLTHNLTIAEDLFSENKKYYQYLDFNDFLIKLAEYSHYNFFSEDTVKDYKNPEIIYFSKIGGVEMGYDKNSLPLIAKTQDQNEIKFSLAIPDAADIILSSYWSRLSKEAVLTGAGVVELFFKEVEAAKENPSLLKPPPQENILSIFTGTLISPAGEGFRLEELANIVRTEILAIIKEAAEILASPLSPIKNFIQGNLQSSNIGSIVESGNSVSSESLSEMTSPKGIGAIPGVNQRFASERIESERAPGTAKPEILQSQSLDSRVQAQVQAQAQVSKITADVVLNASESAAVVLPEKKSAEQNPAILTNPSSGGQPVVFAVPQGAGGEAPRSKPSSLSQSSQQENQQQENQLQPSIPSDTTPPNPPLVVSPSDFSQTFTVSSINFSGTAEASSTLIAESHSDADSTTSTATTTVSPSGNWSLTLNLSQATSTLNFKAQDQAGNTSSSTQIALSIDSISPALSSFSVSECASSLSSEGCLTATTTLHLVWDSRASDIDYYELTQDSNTIATTTATSTVLALADNSSYGFSLRAKDKAGNWSAALTASADTNTMPVVINEVAWAGTSAAHDQDEWIELYNRTSKTIHLNNWILFSQTDFKPWINLSGPIPANGYYLIERTDDNTVKDIAADWTGSFGNGLDNGGEILVLSRASTTIDKTVLCGSGSVRWCPGDYRYRTMERIDPDSAGTDAANWFYNNAIIKNGKDAGGYPISGTPKARNSANYLIATGSSISQDKILKASRSPYFVQSTFTVQNGSTLTVEPGVVIKFYSDSALDILGAIKSEGSSNAPIIFTSFYDDEFGGDTNGDGICNSQNASSTAACPYAGSWYHVRVASSNNDSVFSNSRFRYGGQYYTNGSTLGKGMLKVENTSATIKNSIFEYSKVYGLDLNNSSSTAENSIFRFNAADNLSNGLYIRGGGSPAVSGNTFSGNKIGIRIDSVRATVASNVFSSNSAEAVQSFGPLSSFSGNSGSGNGIGGISIQSTITNPNSGTTTLKSNLLPYILAGSPITVSVSSTLAIEPGAVIKGLSNASLDVYGGLSSEGQNPGDIILTSINDDSSGGDSNNNGASVMPQSGDWRGINVQAGGFLNMKGFTIKYAGGTLGGSDFKGGIQVNNGGAAFIDSALFEKNYLHSVRLYNSSATIKNSTLKNANDNNAPGSVSSLQLLNSNAVLENVTFSDNRLAVYKDSQSTISGVNITFINNIATTSPPNLFP